MNHLSTNLLIICLGTSALCFLCPASTACGQNFLDAVRYEVGGKTDSSNTNRDVEVDNQDDDDRKKRKSRRRHRVGDGRYYDDCDDGNSSFLGNIAGQIIGETVSTAFQSNRSRPSVPREQILFRGFQPYPYFDPQFGRFCADIDLPEYQPYARQLTTEWLVSDQQVDTLRTRLLLESINQFGVDTELAHLRQRPGGNDFYLGDANVVYRLSQQVDSQFRVGVGVNYLADNSNWDTGFNFTYGGDIFLAKPLVLSADIDWGTLGSTNLFHVRSTFGIIHRHSELYAGYDYLSIGAPKQHSFVTGLRFWF